MLLTASADEFVDHYLPYFRQQITTCLLSALLPFQPCPSTLFLCAYNTLYYVFLFSSLFIIHFFVGWGGSVCPGGYAGLSQGWLWEYHLMLICSPVVLLDVSQAGLEPVSGGMGACFLSVTWHGEALYGLGFRVLMMF
jgi:hypothetical protein